MPEVDPSTVKSSASPTLATSSAATRSATPMMISGTSHSTGER